MVFSTWCWNPGGMGVRESLGKMVGLRVALPVVGFVLCLATLMCFGLVGGMSLMLPWYSLGWKHVSVLVMARTTAGVEAAVCTHGPVFLPYYLDGMDIPRISSSLCTTIKK